MPPGEYEIRAARPAKSPAALSFETKSPNPASQTSTLLPIKCGIAGQLVKFRFDRLWSVRRSKQIVYVVCHQWVVSLKRLQRPTCSGIYNPTDDRRGRGQCVGRGLAQILIFVVIALPAKRTGNSLYWPELPCGPEHSPHHVGVRKQFSCWRQIVRILQLRKGEKFLLLLGTHGFQYAVDVVSSRA